jgi:hypothetical protein
LDLDGFLVTGYRKRKRLPLPAVTLASICMANSLQHGDALASVTPHNNWPRKRRMKRPMTTPQTTTTITTTANSRPFDPNKTERKVCLTLKFQFNRDIEMGDWGPFCKRHSLLGGITDHVGDIWVSMKSHVAYGDVDEFIRSLNLDPLVKRAWVTKQEDEEAV